MKRINLLLMLFVAVGMTFSCSDDDNDSQHDMTNDQTNEIVDAMRQGVWRITSFTKNGNDMTDGFEGYNFIFGEQGELLATNGQVVNTGTYSVTFDHSTDASDDDIAFRLHFDSPENFAELRDKWSIVHRTDVKIDLINREEEGEEPEYLTFEKN